MCRHRRRLGLAIFAVRLVLYYVQRGFGRLLHRCLHGLLAWPEVIKELLFQVDRLKTIRYLIFRSLVLGGQSISNLMKVWLFDEHFGSARFDFFACNFQDFSFFNKLLFLFLFIGLIFSPVMLLELLGSLHHILSRHRICLSHDILNRRCAGDNILKGSDPHQPILDVRGD